MTRLMRARLRALREAWLYERWLHKNPAALASVRRGIAQAERGALRDLGFFEQFADDESDA